MPEQIDRWCACRIAALIAGVIYANGVAWNLPVTRYDSWCRLLRDGYLRMAALLSLAATALAITSYGMLRAQAAAPSATRSTAPAPAAAAGAASGPKPDHSYPPAAEAVAVPAETQWSAPQGPGQWQEPPPLPEVPRHPVRGYNYNRTSYQEMASHPRRQAQPAVEVMMA